MHPGDQADPRTWADPREIVLEARAVKRAKERGWLARKMNGLGYMAWPDRLFIPKPLSKRHHSRVRPFWVEFKRRGEKATPLQARLHRELTKRGELVYVIDTFEDFCEIFNRHDWACTHRPGD